MRKPGCTAVSRWRSDWKVSDVLPAGMTIEGIKQACWIGACSLPRLQTFGGVVLQELSGLRHAHARGVCRVAHTHQSCRDGVSRSSRALQARTMPGKCQHHCHTWHGWNQWGFWHWVETGGIVAGMKDFAPMVQVQCRLQVLRAFVSFALSRDARIERDC